MYARISTTMCCNTSILSYNQAVANPLSLSPPEENNLQDHGQRSCPYWHTAQQGKGAAPIGGTINRSFISAHFLLAHISLPLRLISTCAPKSTVLFLLLYLLAIANYINTGLSNEGSSKSSTKAPVPPIHSRAVVLCHVWSGKPCTGTMLATVHIIIMVC